MKKTWLVILGLLLGLPFSVLAETKGFSPGSMAYVLQADRFAASRSQAVEKLAGCDRDLIVVDAAFNSNTGDWTREEIETIRQGREGRRVMAYVSIGEAEDYRPYWQKSWDADKDGIPDAAAPRFLNTENPYWEGNYRVRYWHPEWQAIILKAVEKVVRQGFDGIYLDIVDAFEFYEFDPVSKEWRDNLVNEETGQTYCRDMVAWVAAIAQTARSINAAFLVIPQNAATLLEHEDYRQIISGIAVEDLFVSGKKLRTEKDMRYIIGYLERLKPEGKPIFTVDYPDTVSLHEAVFARAAKQGYVSLLTDRNLTTLGESQ